VDHFADRKSRLVYLTADSTTELEDVDNDCIYIIGGLIDHNR
jgi:tRNA (guanine9-N1)-methyltransferase